MVWTVRRSHKWIAVASSLVLLMWCVTGLAYMFLPETRVQSRSAPAPVWHSADVSPAAAARAGATALGERALAPSSVQLRALLGAPFYSLEYPDGRTVFVDAVTGAAVVMDSTLAGRIAADARGVEISGVRRLELHELTYPMGELPVFVVDFVDSGPRAYVSARTGIVLGTSSTLMRQGLSALHDGRVIGAVLGQPARRAFMGGFGVLTLVAIFSGLWLVAAGVRSQRSRAMQSRQA